jgi:hypothetical protein
MVSRRPALDIVEKSPAARTYTRVIGLVDGIKRLFSGAKAEAEGEEPVAIPQGEDERETSTNEQVSGASGQPWPDRD